LADTAKADDDDPAAELEIFRRARHAASALKARSASVKTDVAMKNKMSAWSTTVETAVVETTCAWYTKYNRPRTKRQGQTAAGKCLL
jgi:hypothetical protein